MTARSLPEIQSALEQLVDRWSRYSGTERSGSQTFLNQLIGAYTGAQDVFEAGATFEQFGPRDEGVGFMDLYWPGVAIIEMKAPKESGRLDAHRAQVLDYWRNSADPQTGTPAPPFLVLCSIRSFEVWEPGRFPNAPRDVFTIEELPSRAEALLFLAGKTPVYGGPGAAVTQEAAKHMVDLYFQLLDRDAAPADELRRFIVQAVWALFAEDLGLIPERVFGNLVDALVADPSRSSAVEFTDLFRRFNQSDDERRNRGRAVSVPYVNGELFAATPEVPLNAAELRHLQAAAAYDWRWVNPTVFGALLEGCLGHDHRWELGAHYTNEEDILSIVRPVIVRPWMQRIDAVDTPGDAINLLNELTKFEVLDPAMGCSNFLAIAYRELRKLERHLSDRITDLHAAAGMFPPTLPRYPLKNIHGIEIDPFAVEIAKATLWMTHALMARQYGAAEAPLPLQSLDTLVCADSLEVEWPRVDAIIGNPPFHGDRRLRAVVGDDYIDWLKKTFGVGVKDHCVYFFRKAHEQLREGQRAGLVATNTISQAKNRDASLAWIVANGGTIFDATSTKPWSGEAKVHVSIMCWEKGDAPPPYVLDGREVEGITPSLTVGTQHRQASPLERNSGIAFQGNNLLGSGFVVDEIEARRMLEDSSADYASVVKPLLAGEDIARTAMQSPARWAIDFGSMSLEDAGAWPMALDIVRERVKPARASAKRESYRRRWWQYAEPVPTMRAALLPLARYAACGITGKRLLVIWAEPHWVPTTGVCVFALADSYSFGILTSSLHEVWARATGSTLKGDLRYTPTTVFRTFPWPTAPSDRCREAVSVAADRIVLERRAACDKLGRGLTAVYNAMDDGAYVDLARAHRDLDLAVMACYGLPVALLDDRSALVDALFDLNAAAAADPTYDPFGRR